MGKQLAELVLIEPIGELEINEPRTGNFRRMNEGRINIKMADDLGCQLTRVLPETLGNHHCNIRSQVTMFRLPGLFEGNVGCNAK
jgi:hypothetical protein